MTGDYYSDLFSSMFYAYDRVKRKVLYHVFGRRTKATLNRLLTLLGHASICYFMTEAWPVYLSVLLAEKHIIGKRWTQRIERHNLNLRTHIKPKDNLFFKITRDAR